MWLKDRPLGWMDGRNERGYRAYLLLIGHYLTRLSLTPMAPSLRGAAYLLVDFFEKSGIFWKFTFNLLFCDKRGGLYIACSVDSEAAKEILLKDTDWDGLWNQRGSLWWQLSSASDVKLLNFVVAGTTVDNKSILSV
ncbi:hypothetical protein NPIL_111781 [Nephila pilipes]|uniref:Uncharacterized protein n=1 Tax=Nephila pilipes TaxID=299642 RepID=A0A8X6PEP7_NEPPI|nr:hypothetical protein NPIL_111781 [Nephila pilipes]